MAGVLPPNKIWTAACTFGFPRYRVSLVPTASIPKGEKEEIELRLISLPVVVLRREEKRECTLQ